MHTGWSRFYIDNHWPPTFPFLWGQLHTFDFYLCSIYRQDFSFALDLYLTVVSRISGIP